MGNGDRSNYLETKQRICYQRDSNSIPKFKYENLTEQLLITQPKGILLKIKERE